MNMRRLINIVEAARKPKARPNEKDIERIRAIRKEARDHEGGYGMCHEVSEWIMMKYGWERESGAYCTRDGEVCISGHYWNVLPDGSILDATADQTGDGHDIRIIAPSDPDHARYKREWDDDGNSFSDQQYDDQDRLRAERGHGWWVSNQDQWLDYHRQQYKDYLNPLSADILRARGEIK